MVHPSGDERVESHPNATNCRSCVGRQPAVARLRLGNSLRYVERDVPLRDAFLRRARTRDPVSPFELQAKATAYPSNLMTFTTPTRSVGMHSDAFERMLD